MKLLTIVLTFSLVSATSLLHAQSPTTPPSAPLPGALAKATRLFLGNAGDQENGDCLRVYNDFYHGLHTLGRFTLVDDPGAADLVLELHYEISLGASVVTDHNGDSVRPFRVAFLDPRSHVVLWSLTERTNYAVRQKNRDRNLDDIVTALVADTKLLLAPTPVAPNNDSRPPHN